MDPIYVLVEYNGWWKRVDNGLWEWCGSGLTGGFVVDRGIKFLELVEMIYQKTSINQNDHAIEITHKPVGDKHVKTTPILISNDSEFKDLMFWCKSEDLITIHATLKENRKGKWEIGMDPIYVLLEYNGRWKQIDSGFWEWRGSDLAKAFVVDRSIKFRKLVEIIYHKASINRSVYTIEITHKFVGDKHVKAAPTLISDDLDFTNLRFGIKTKIQLLYTLRLKRTERREGKVQPR